MSDANVVLFHRVLLLLFIRQQPSFLCDSSQPLTEEHVASSSASDIGSSVRRSHLGGHRATPRGTRFQGPFGGDAEAKYSCDQCMKCFDKLSSFTRHKYEHSGIQGLHSRHLCLLLLCYSRGSVEFVRIQCMGVELHRGQNCQHPDG